MKREFKDNARFTNDHSSRAHETIKRQTLKKGSYVLQVNELEETI